MFQKPRKFGQTFMILTSNSLLLPIKLQIKCIYAKSITCTIIKNIDRIQMSTNKKTEEMPSAKNEHQTIESDCTNPHDFIVQQDICEGIYSENRLEFEDIDFYRYLLIQEQLAQKGQGQQQQGQQISTLFNNDNQSENQEQSPNVGEEQSILNNSEIIAPQAQENPVKQSEPTLLQTVFDNYLKAWSKSRCKDKAKLMRIQLLNQLRKPRQQMIHELLDPECLIGTQVLQVQPQYVQFFCNVIINYDINNTKSQNELLSSISVSEKEVYKEKLIFRWKEFLGKHGMRIEDERISLEHFLQVEKISEAQVRSQCDKNLVAFFSGLFLRLFRYYKGEQNNSKGRANLRENYPYIKNFYKKRPDRFNRFQATLPKLSRFLRQIPKQMWEKAFTQVKIYKEVKYQSKLKQQTILKKYYYCFIPRLAQIRNDPEDAKHIWKWNFSDNDLDIQSLKEKIKAERSFETAKRYEQKWVRQLKEKKQQLSDN